MHVERLKTLYEMLDGIPEQKVKLAHWWTGQSGVMPCPVDYTKDELEDCGTLACAVGWACLYPPFIEMGLKGDWATPTFGKEEDWDAVMRFFDLTMEESTELFTRYTKDHLHLSDKQYVLHKIRDLLLTSRQITVQRYRELNYVA